MKNIENKPLVSVLMPCYNAEKFLGEAMDSILNQSYLNIEVIAINDCSTDSTAEILESIARRDSRVKVYTNEVNLKLIDTLNKGVDLCSGKYIARMDSDDISLPQRIEKEVEFLEQHADHGIVSTQFYTFRTGSDKLYPYKNPTEHEELQAYLLFKSGICHPACMIRKTVFTELGLKFEKAYLHVEDYALWSKAIYKTKLANLGGEPLLYYRVHDTQVSTLNDEFQTRNKREVFKIHCEKLGLDNSQEGLDIYASVAEADPVYSSSTFLDKCESFMLSLIEKNETTPFCSSLFLKNILALHWIRLCANSQLGLGVLKKCRKSDLYKKEFYSDRDILILYFKCLFRIKYKESWIYSILFR